MRLCRARRLLAAPAMSSGWRFDAVPWNALRARNDLAHLFDHHTCRSIRRASWLASAMPMAGALADRRHDRRAARHAGSSARACDHRVARPARRIASSTPGMISGESGAAGAGRTGGISNRSAPAARSCCELRRDAADMIQSESSPRQRRFHRRLAGSEPGRGGQRRHAFREIVEMKRETPGDRCA